MQVNSQILVLQALKWIYNLPTRVPFVIDSNNGEVLSNHPVVFLLHEIVVSTVCARGMKERAVLLCAPFEELLSHKDSYESGQQFGPIWINFLNEHVIAPG
ncbi:hypothetical protein KU891_27785 (plasmid) [Bacillus tropicus]|uniref:hypothetical protein n=1 Tax=Bacillus tropicus TaxID=2026188 RepID=UPI002006A9C7|nr:hypothetical protein [Bacillus tropicus]UOK49136.1 hypothetical protein KU891_27785 [Bacillus tropicus]